MKHTNTYTAARSGTIKSVAIGLALALGLLVTPTGLFIASGEAEENAHAFYTDAMEIAQRRTVDELTVALDRHAEHRMSPDERLTLAEIVADAGRRHGVDPFLLLAVISVESEFHQSARSQRGAMGFMQLKNKTAFDVSGRMRAPMGALGLADWQTNVELGAAYLRHCHDHLGSWPLALAAYNWGPARVRAAVKANGSRLPSFMRGYEKRVAKNYQRLSRLAGVELVRAPLQYGPMIIRDAI